MIGKNIKESWLRWQTSTRDLIVISISSFAVWFVIERTETCDRFFKWVAENPEYEVDSIILAFILASTGITIFAFRRYRDMIVANRAQSVAENRNYALAYNDMLTGLPNRLALNERLAALSTSGPSCCAALIILDLDRFKAVNDVHGHLVGDRLLRLVAMRIRSAVGSEGATFRLGGDEFAILVATASTVDDTPQDIARQIVHLLAQPFTDESLVHHIGASAGIALFPSDASDATRLVRAADVALYRAKESGRGKHRCYESQMDENIKRRALLETEMRSSIEAGEFCPYFQPLIDLQTGFTIGFELLARWIRADGQQIGPDQFISIAEESGLINDLMINLLDQACIDARSWDPALTIAINISPFQLKDPWLSYKLLDALARHGFAPSRLAIEITENAIIADEENAKRTIELLKNQGMRISLDDFGTGYASLHHLHTLPLDKIKIDRSFIMNLATDTEALKIASAIVQLAISLDLTVVAEGIESAEVAALVRSLGCAQGQGYYFGKAMSADIVTRELQGTAPPHWLEFDPEPEIDIPVPIRIASGS